MRKIVLVVVLAIFVSGMTFAAPDFLSLPGSMSKGNWLISPTFSFGSVGGGWGGLGSRALSLSAAFDYALPINFPLLVGAQAGFVFLTGAWLYDKPVMVPIFAKIGYHPSLGIDQLNVYVQLKMGFNLALGTDWTGGFAFGFNVGGRWFFTNAIGAFLEVGYDRYGFRYEYAYHGSKYRYNMYAGTYVHAGVTFKLGK